MARFRRCQLKVPPDPLNILILIVGYCQTKNRVEKRCRCLLGRVELGSSGTLGETLAASKDALTLELLLNTKKLVVLYMMVSGTYSKGIWRRE